MDTQELGHTAHRSLHGAAGVVRRSAGARPAARTGAGAAGALAVGAAAIGAIAIGALAGMFSVVNTVLLKPLPYANSDRLVVITASAPGSDLPEQFGVSSEFFVQYREQARLLEDVSTFNSGTSTLRVGDRVERVRMSWPTYTLFSVLGAKPVLGRLPTAEDERVAVIS